MIWIRFSCALLSSFNLILRLQPFTQNLILGYGSILLSTLGIIANTTAIVILTRHKELSKFFFNWLLTTTAINDNVFLVISIIVAIAQHVCKNSTNDYIYVNYIYPLRSVSLFVSIYMMILLSYERYKAVSQSTDYEGNVYEMHNPWTNLLTKVGLIILGSFAVNISTFWELQMRKENKPIITANNSNIRLFDKQNLSKYIEMSVTLSSYRFQHRGVYRYLAVFNILIKNVIPLILLIYFNVTIFRALVKLYERRRQMNNIESECYKKTEHNISNLIVLLSIVVVFIGCHALCPVRILSTLINFENEQLALKYGCIGVKYWMLIVTSISNFLIVVNASTNLFIYLVINPRFKIIFVKLIC